MGKTSTEVKQRWENANYSRYVVRLRKDTDANLIGYIESRKAGGERTSDIFREALELLAENNNK